MQSEKKETSWWKVAVFLFLLNAIGWTGWFPGIGPISAWASGSGATGSTWPGVLMHTVSNLLTVSLLTGGHITLAGRTEILFTPGWHGIVFMILVSLAGLAVYRKR